MVISRPQKYRDVRQAHYTTSAEIVGYMVARLDCRSEDSVWEPCGGSGELVEGILRACSKALVRVSEIDGASADALKQTYEWNPNITVVCEDALNVGSQSTSEDSVKFTRIIANPPYGAWQTPDRRAQLKKQFPGLYVRDTYGVFLAHCLNLLECGGRLVFIIPDTFLWLNRHEPLRRKLLTESTIEEIALFPSNFFPNVNFGYSGLSILSLVKEPPSRGTSIRLIDQVRDVSVLNQLSQDRFYTGRCVVSRVKQDEIVSAAHSVVPRTASEDGIVLNCRPAQALGDVADLKTGFYSGNDRNWLRRANSSVPRSKGYVDIQSDQIAEFGNGCTPPLEGIDGVRHYIPVVRGGASPFVKQTTWYVDWSTQAIKEYRRPGKHPARFQNSRFYFRDGIGIPMVASSRLTAAWLNNRLFDQGIVGLFPRDRQLSLYLLGFLNTQLATVLLRRINGTANNSANYLKRLPIVSPSEIELAKANELISTAISEVLEHNSLSESIAQEMEEFYRTVWCDG